MYQISFGSPKRTMPANQTAAQDLVATIRNITVAISSALEVEKAHIQINTDFATQKTM